MQPQILFTKQTAVMEVMHGGPLFLQSQLTSKAAKLICSHLGFKFIDEVIMLLK